MMKRIILPAIFVLVMFAAADGQDPSYSNFSMSPLYYNPASCGNNNELDFRLSYRNLWYGIKPMFRTYKFSSTINIPGVGGLGILAMSDTEGEGFLRTDNIGLCYSNTYVITEDHLAVSMGLLSSFVQKSIDWSSLRFGDEYDKILGRVYESGFTPPQTNSVIYPDFNAGILVKTGFGRTRNYRTRFYNEFGFSMSHLTRPDNSLIGIGSKLPIKYVVQFKGVYLHSEYKNRVLLTPMVLYERQAPMSTLAYGVHFMLDPVYLGLTVRNRYIADAKSFDAISVCIGILNKFHNDTKLNISYNYDFNISRLAPGMLGSHEINIYFSINNVRSICNNPNTKMIPCPDESF